MARALIDFWAVTVGAVLVYVQNWIALAVIFSLLLRLRRAGQSDPFAKMLVSLDEIKERLEAAVVLPRKY